MAITHRCEFCGEEGPHDEIAEHVEVEHDVPADDVDDHLEVIEDEGMDEQGP